MTEHWNGAEWAFVFSANTGPTQGNFLFDVACASASDCWAVGDHLGDSGPYQTLIEHWNGNKWTIVTSPNTSSAQDNRLFGVTCASGSDCWAVGDYYNGSVYQTLVEHWNGNAWTIVSSPDTSASQRNYFGGVTCVSSSDCWAFGAHENSSGIRQTLTEHWNGTAWATVSSPSTSATEDNRIAGVACMSASDCWAVGAYYDDINQQNLIEHWNGTAWKIVTAPHSSDTEESLSGITCVSSSDCWAVGYYGGGDYYEPQIVHYSTSNKLGNISTRLDVQTGGNVAIAGFIVSGQPQKVLIRALGPTLASPPFNVPGTLGDPKLVLYDKNQIPIASSDNWPSTVIDGTVITEDQEYAIYYSGYRPSSNKESVIIAALPAGNYTAIVSGVNNTSGVALVEVYDLTPTDSGSLTNISTRGSVQTGNNVMIGGFIVRGAGSRTVVVRGLGPTLANFGVAGALGDPTMELRDSNGNLLASDDNWKDVQQTEIQSTGRAPPNDLEPAILATLAPANYTAILRGKNNTIGVALVEAYVTN